MAPRHRALVVLGALAVTATAARAQPAPPARVEVRPLAGQVVPVEMIDTLRIHLTGAAVVEPGPPLAGATLAERIAEASGALARGGLVTWLDSSPDEHGVYVLVIVGERDGRAAVEVGRLDGRDPGALSRVIALRVAAFVDETIAAGASSPIAVPAAVAPRVASVAPVAPRASAVRAIAELGGGGESDGDGLHADGAIAIGARLDRTGRRIEAVAIGRLSWPRATAGAVTLGVLDVGACGRMVVPLGPAWIGGALELGARRVDAEAVMGGSAVRWLARARLAIDARLALSPGVSVRATLGLERGLSVERFTVHGATVAEVGAFAGTGSLGLVFLLAPQ